MDEHRDARATLARNVKGHERSAGLAWRIPRPGRGGAVLRGRQTMGLRAGQASAPLRGLAMGLAGERTRHPATPSPCCRLALDQQAARRGRSGLAAVCYIYCSGLQRPGPALPPLPWRPRLYFRIVEEIGAFPARCPPGVPTTACPWRAPARRPCARPAGPEGASGGLHGFDSRGPRNPRR